MTRRYTKQPGCNSDSPPMAVPSVDTLTHCPYCSLQCGILMIAGDRPATLRPQDDFPTNRGGLCSKGWTAAELLDHPDRLLHPAGADGARRPDQPAAAGVAGTRRSTGSSAAITAHPGSGTAATRSGASAAAG